MNFRQKRTDVCLSSSRDKRLVCVSSPANRFCSCVPAQNRRLHCPATPVTDSLPLTDKLQLWAMTSTHAHTSPVREFDLENVFTLRVTSSAKSLAWRPTLYFFPWKGLFISHICGTLMMKQIMQTLETKSASVWFPCDSSHSSKPDSSSWRVGVFSILCNPTGATVTQQSRLSNDCKVGSKNPTLSLSETTGCPLYYPVCKKNLSGHKKRGCPLG